MACKDAGVGGGEDGGEEDEGDVNDEVVNVVETTWTLRSRLNLARQNKKKQKKKKILVTNHFESSVSHKATKSQDTSKIALNCENYSKI